MPFTMTPAGVLNQIYTTRVLLTDWLNESVKKISRLGNPGSAGNQQALWRAFEGATNAALEKATQTATVIISDQSNAATSSGQHWAGVEHVLVLGFTRVHPLNATKTLEASFGIPAPVDAIIDTSNGQKPLIVRGVDFASAAGITESVGAMVDFLEDALVYTDIEDTVHVGGWTYSEAKSGLLSNPRLIDSVSNS